MCAGGELLVEIYIHEVVFPFSLRGSCDIHSPWPAESSRQRAERGGVGGRRRREEGRGKRR